MTEWDWEYFSMSDEDFAYATELSREKIEKAKQKEKSRFLEAIEEASNEIYENFKRGGNQKPLINQIWEQQKLREQYETANQTKDTVL